MERYTIVFLVFSICLAPCFSSQDYPIDFIHKVSARSASPQFGGGWNNNEDLHRDAANTANTAAHAATFTANVLSSPFRLAGAAASSAAHGAFKRSANPQFGGGWNNNEDLHRDAANTANTAAHAATFTANVLSSPFRLAGAAASSAAHGAFKRSANPQFGGGWNNNEDLHRDAANTANTAAHAATFTANVLSSPFRLAGAAASSAAHGAFKRSANPQFGGGWNNNEDLNRDAANTANTAAHAATFTANVLSSPFRLAGAAASSAAHGAFKRSANPQFGGGWNNNEDLHRDAANTANSAAHAATFTANVLSSPFRLAGAAASSAAHGAFKRSANPQFGGGWNNNEDLNRDAANTANTAAHAATFTANVLSSPFRLAGAAASSAAHGAFKRSANPQFGGGWNNNEDLHRDAANTANTAAHAATFTANVLSSPFRLAGAAASSAAHGAFKRSANPQFGGGWNNNEDLHRDAANTANTAAHAATFTANVLSSPFRLAGAAASSAAHGAFKRSANPQFGGGWNNNEDLNRDAANTANTAAHAATFTANVLSSPFRLAGAAASSAAHGAFKRSANPQFGGGWNNNEDLNRDAANTANTAAHAATFTANVLSSPFRLAGAAASSAAHGAFKRSANPQFGGGWNNNEDLHRDAANTANTAAHAATFTANVLSSPFRLAGAAASSAAHGAFKRSANPQFGGGWNNNEDLHRDAANTANTAAHAATFTANVLSSPFRLAGAAASSAAHGAFKRSANPQFGGGWNNNEDLNRDATNTANTAAHAATFTANVLTSPFRLAGLAANSAVHGASKRTGSGQIGIFGGNHDDVNRGATDTADLTQKAAGHAATFVSNIFTAPFKLAGAAATAAHGAVTHSGRGHSGGGQSVISSTQNSGLAGNNADYNSDAANAANTAAHAATFTANVLNSPFRLAGAAVNSAAHGATTNTGQSTSGQYNGLTINNNGANRGAVDDLTNYGVGHSGNVVSNSVGAPLNHPGAGAAVENAAHNNAVNVVGGASGQSGFYDSKSQQSSSFGGQSSGSGEKFSANSMSGGDYGTQSSANKEFQGVDGNTARTGGFNQKFSKSESFKESHYSYQSNNDGGSNFGSQSLGSAQAYGGGNEQQREQQFGLGHGAARHEVGSLNEGVLSAGNGQWQQGLSHGVGTSSDGAGFTFGVAPTGLGYQRSGAAPNALAGALNLASLGLISASQTRCSTCGLGGYALSNSKSTDGDAIALSIGV